MSTLTRRLARMILPSLIFGAVVFCLVLAYALSPVAASVDVPWLYVRDALKLVSWIAVVLPFAVGASLSVSLVLDLIGWVRDNGRTFTPLRSGQD